MAYSTIEVLTFAGAMIGTFLGVLNTWRSVSSDKVRLKVKPVNIVAEDPRLEFGIEVINLSQFPVTVREIGFLFSGTSKRTPIIEYMNRSGHRLPIRLEPRTSTVFYFEKPNAIPGHRFRCAYAQTDCESCITGKSPALAQLN